MMRQLFAISKQRPYWGLALVAIAGALIGVVALGQSAASLSPPGANYVLEMTTVVVGPTTGAASSPNIGSNVNFRENDQVKWVVYTGPPQPKSGDDARGVPETIRGTVTLPTGFGPPDVVIGPPNTIFVVSDEKVTWTTSPDKIQRVTSSASTITKTITVDLGEYFKCDPGRDTIVAWDKIRFDQPLSWGDGLSSIQVNVKRHNGVHGGFIDLTPPIVLPPMTASSGSTTIPKSFDISSIPVEERFLQFEITFTKSSTGSLASLTSVPIDVTWKGDQAQVCFQATAGAGTSADSDLTTSASVTFSPAGATVTNTVPLNASQRFDNSDNAHLGFGPSMLVAPLTNASGTAAQDVVLMSSFDMQMHKGDVSVYKADNLATPYSRAENNLKTGGGNATVSDRPLHYSAMYSPEPASFGRIQLIWDLMLRSEDNLNTKGPTNEVVNLSRTFTYLTGQGIYNRYDPIAYTDSLVEKRMQYLRGSRLLEPPNNQGNAFRKRNGILGPVVNSSPVWLPRNPQVGYPENLFSGYEAFRKDSRIDRFAPYALFGGHDGMLHAFKVTEAGLEESFAFIPYTFLSEAYRYTNGSQAQLGLTPFASDSTPMVRDVKLDLTDDPWRTVVVVSKGRKSRGIYAVDVTTRYAEEDKVKPGFPFRATLWDYTNLSTLPTVPTTTADGLTTIDASELRDLGEMVYDPPVDDVVGAEQIVRMNNNKWAAVVGNGINSHIGTDPSRNGTGRAVLYLFYFVTHANPGGGARKATSPLWLRIPVSESDPTLAFDNGLLSPRPFDIDADGKVDYIYAGDMKGNLWRFDVRDLSNVKVARLFKTTGDRPILAAPAVRPFKGSTPCKVEKTCQIVVFGTGYPASPLTPGPSTVANDHALYAIVDNNSDSNAASVSAGTVANSTSPVISVSQLQEQTLESEADATGTVRSVNNTAVNYDAAENPRKGWWRKLWKGEQMVANPLVSSNNQVLFTTGRYWPFRDDATLRAKNSWFTQLELLTGAAAPVLLRGGTRNASVSIGHAVYGAPGILKSSTDPTMERLLVAPAPGTTMPGGVDRQAAPQPLGRLSWREITGN